MKYFFYQSNKGFTLLEITATLMIIFFLSGLAGLAIENYIDAYALHKQHTEVAQQARLVINRLVNEFVHINQIRSGTTDEISFRSRFNNLRITTISYFNKDNCLKINNEIVSDKISDFKLRYLAGVNVFDDVDSKDIWENRWIDGQSTAIQFDISFKIELKILKHKRTHSIDFNNITVVPRTLGALD